MVDVQNVDLNDGGTIDISGTTLEVNVDFIRESQTGAILATDNTSNLNFVGSASDGVFDSGSLFTINGKILVNKPSKQLTLQEAIRVNGDVEVTSSSSFVNTTFLLNDFLQMGATSAQTTATPQPGTFTASSTIETTGDFALLFVPNGNAAVRDCRHGYARQRNHPQRCRRGGSDPVIDVVDNVEFKGTLTLRSGGLDATASGADFSPVGDEAEVVRWIDDSSTSFTGSFNADQNPYDLRYTRTGSNDTAAELTDEVRDLTVDSGSEPLLDADYDINGVLTVNGTISENENSGSSVTRSLFLKADSVQHAIAGVVTGTNEGGDDDRVVIQVDGNASTILGDDASGSNSEIQDIVIAGENTTISDVQQITGTLTMNDGGNLTLGLSNPDTGDQTIQGTATVADSLVLASDVEVTSASGTDDVIVSGANSAIYFGDFNITLTGDGADFNGDSDANYLSTGGRLVFDNATTTSPTDQTFGTDDIAVPNVTVSTPITLTENTAVNNDLQVDDEIASGGNNLRFSGQGTLATSTSLLGAGALIAEGTTLTVTVPGSGNTTSDVSNFTIDSDTSTVTVDAGSGGDDLTVSDVFTLASGTLDHATDIILTGTAFNFEGTEQNSVIATSGEIVFESDARIKSWRRWTTRSPSRICVSRAMTQTSVSLASSSADLTIGAALDLEEQFLTDASAGGLVIADAVTITRSAYTPNDVLDAKPTFANTYNLVYETNSYDTGNEVDTADSTIVNVDIGVVPRPTSVRRVL